MHSSNTGACFDPVDPESDFLSSLDVEGLDFTENDK